MLLSRNSASRFRSSIELSVGHRAAIVVAVAAAAFLVIASGCGDDGGDDGGGDGGRIDASDQVCGPGAAPMAGIAVTVGGETLTYGGFTSSPNNDCPPPEGGPTSLTVDGTQVGATSQVPPFLTLCLPRPAQIAAQPISLDDDNLVQFANINGELADDCDLVLDRRAAPSGTIEFAGYCGGGQDAAGYAITLSGTVPGTRSCPDGGGGTVETPVDIALSGQVAVEAINIE